jgi:hypothetical protein
MKNIKNAYDIAMFVYDCYVGIANQIINNIYYSNNYQNSNYYSTLGHDNYHNLLTVPKDNEINIRQSYNDRIRMLNHYAQKLEKSSNYFVQNSDVYKTSSSSTKNVNYKNFYAMQLFKIYNFQRVVIQIDYLPDAQKTPALQDMFDKMIEKLPDFYIPRFLVDLVPSKYNGYYSFVANSIHIKHIEMVFKRNINTSITFETLLSSDNDVVKQM